MKIVLLLMRKLIRTGKIWGSILLGLMYWSAQSQSITISEELPMRSDYAYTIMGWIGGDLLLFRDKGHEFFVQAFDTDMHLKWEREVYLGDHKADVIGIVAHPNRFHVIYGMR
ncbi:MAG TPA: hypothetical protein VJ508_16450, partial [Saprospiraceae bacterium]|nr:hypothetical protein [Saprospiraceae bacterium]